MLQIQIAAAREAEKIVEQILQPSALLADHFDFGQRPAFARRSAFGEILGQELHVHANHGEWVLDLMRQRTGQFRQFKHIARAVRRCGFVSHDRSSLTCDVAARRNQRTLSRVTATERYVV